MSRDNYYFAKSTKHVENTITALLSFNSEHSIFKGHFPGRPIVPGVCMIQIVKELLAAQLNERMMLESAVQVKFLQALIPEEGLEVDLDLQYQRTESDKVSVYARFLIQSRTVFKFQGQFKLNTQGR